MALKDRPIFAEFYKNKRILITGASGYIAWNLIRELVQFDCTIVCFSRNVEKVEKQNDKAKIKFVESSYQCKSVYQEAIENVDIIFHLASQTSVYKAEKNPLADYRANVLPMQLLLEACRKNKTCPTIVFSGTSTQCGMPEMLPVDENVIDIPLTTYDFHKLQAERWLKFYTCQDWVRGVSLRLTNVYGPGPRSSSADRGMLNLMIIKALQGEELTIFGTGEFIRDYIYVDDVVSAFLSAPIHISDINGKHFVLGSGISTTIHDAIELVGELVSQQTGKKVVVKRVEPPTYLLPIECRNFFAAINSLQEEISFIVKYDLQNGIKNSINYYSKGN